MRYCETITKTLAWDHTHKRQTGGTGEYAKVRIRFQPGEPDSGFVFENAVRGSSIPDAFIPAVERGLATAKETGSIAGFPVIDFKCILLDGGYHDVDSTERSFETAARACFREAMPKAGPRLMEPMMKVEVVTPEDHMGDVIGDLNSRRGQVTGADPRTASRSSPPSYHSPDCSATQHAEAHDPGPCQMHHDLFPLRAGPTRDRPRRRHFPARNRHARIGAPYSHASTSVGSLCCT